MCFDGLLADVEVLGGWILPLTDPGGCSQTRRAFESRTLKEGSLDSFLANGAPTEMQP